MSGGNEWNQRPRTVRNFKVQQSNSDNSLCDSESSSEGTLSNSFNGTSIGIMGGMNLVNSARFDSEWRIFLNQWSQPRLRLVVAECVPELVGIIWQDEFLEISSYSTCKAVELERRKEPILLTRADQEAVSATRRLVNAIINRTRITTAALLLALFFVHRYRTLPASEMGCAGSQYRMFLIGMLLAHKYSEDHPFSNRVWAQLSELPVMHVNMMERDFLQRIDHRLSVKLDDFQKWVVALDRRFDWTGSRYNIPSSHDYRTMPLPPPPPSSSSLVMGKMSRLATPAPVKARDVYTHPVGQIEPAPPSVSIRRYSQVFSL